ncbi:hypothetical protein [Pseudomonas citronellolis]|uniref:hypothetical protein n=1 Tax=Pseudomonas citronellolis TaxID=53408 RepID=UPI000A7CA1C4|nr:hypothetical protein [Pseudomonas citronellolis]
MNQRSKIKIKIKCTIGTFLKFIHNIFLNNVKLFQASVLTRKKVAIIGPAESSMTYMSGLELEKLDFLVRVNKSYLSLSGKEKELGNRTDLLFHCFNEDPITGGGKLDFALLEQQNNKFTIYPYAKAELERKFYTLALKHRQQSLYRIPSHYYIELERGLNGYIPTTGLQALIYLLDQDFAELHITGFTFFRTPYVKDYRDSHQSAEKAYNLATSQGSHHPERELSVFCKRLAIARNAGKKVILDKALENIVLQINPIEEHT